jgi:hypothetical protein
MTLKLYTWFRILLILAFSSIHFYASALICKNGVIATLDGSGQLTLPAEDFVLDNNSCCLFGISYGISLDNGITYQPTASFDCDDLGQIPVRVRFTDCLGQPNVCETYVIVQGVLGVCDTGCGGCCLPTAKVRGLNVVYYDNFTTEIHASWFDDGSYSNCAAGPLRFSFSQDTGDSTMLLNCDYLGQMPIQLWVTDPAGYKTYSEAFVIVQLAYGDCTGTGPCLPSPVAFNGLVLPLRADGKLCISASDFDLGSYVSACSGATSLRFSFSSNPNDTVYCFDCNHIGQQAVEIFTHDNLGNMNYAVTYVVVEDNGDYCTTPANLAPPNDAVCNAYDINYLLNSGCCESFFNIGADAGTNEVTPPLGACGVPNTWCDGAAVAEKTVWFKFEAPAAETVTFTTSGMNTQLALWDAASCGVLIAGFATLVAANDDDPAQPNGGSKLEEQCLQAGKTYFLQMDGHTNSEGYFCLKFTATGPACTDAAGEELAITPVFAIQPNPASSFVNIIVENPADWRQSKAIVSDMSGKRVFAQKMEGKNQRLDVGGLSPGIYFIHLQNNGHKTPVQKLAIFR